MLPFSVGFLGKIVNKQRPVNLDLTTIKFPLPAITSILHRLSGILLFFLIPLLLYGLSHSLRSEESFQHLSTALTHTGIKVLLILMLSALVFHWIAGIRHMLMDYGIGESLSGGRLGAKFVFLAFILVMIGMVFWIW